MEPTRSKKKKSRPFLDFTSMSDFCLQRPIRVATTSFGEKYPIILVDRFTIENNDHAY